MNADSQRDAALGWLRDEIELNFDVWPDDVVSMAMPNRWAETRQAKIARSMMVWVMRQVLPGRAGSRRACAEWLGLSPDAVRGREEWFVQHAAPAEWRTARALVAAVMPTLRRA